MPTHANSKAATTVGKAATASSRTGATALCTLAANENQDNALQQVFIRKKDNDNT